MRNEELNLSVRTLSMWCDGLLYRREQLWPTLDLLLLDSTHATPAVTTPYMAAILEYRVVFYDDARNVYQEVFSLRSRTPGTHDVNHPCRQAMNFYALMFD